MCPRESVLNCFQAQPVDIQCEYIQEGKQSMQTRAVDKQNISSPEITFGKLRPIFASQLDVFKH